MDLAVSECARVCVETLPIDPIGQVIGRIGDRKARWVLKNNATVERFEQAFLQKVGQDVKAELGAEDCEKYFIQPLASELIDGSDRLTQLLIIYRTQTWVSRWTSKKKVPLLSESVHSPLRNTFLLARFHLPSLPILIYRP